MLRLLAINQNASLDHEKLASFFPRKSKSNSLILLKCVQFNFAPWLGKLGLPTSPLKKLNAYEIWIIGFKTRPRNWIELDKKGRYVLNSRWPKNIEPHTKILSHVLKVSRPLKIPDPMQKMISHGGGFKILQLIIMDHQVLWMSEKQKVHLF